MIIDYGNNVHFRCFSRIIVRECERETERQKADLHIISSIIEQSNSNNARSLQ